MAQYTAGSEHVEQPAISAVANPIPLGMSAFAFTTALIGCIYAGFIVPFGGSTIALAAMAAIIYGGIVQILAGMWEFRRDNTIAATLFTAYGGFLVAFGLAFVPTLGVASALTHAGVLHTALGLFFLCWTIFSAVLFVGSLRTNIAFLIVLLLMFVSFLLLTIGELAGASTILLIIGGWVGIVSALVAWYVALAGMVNGGHSIFRLPTGAMTME
jgi:succinate-acetate transporter protein